MITLKLNKQAIDKKVNNKRLGLLIAHEWKRLINPYTPRDTGQLMNNVDELPFALHYRVPYAAKMYNGTDYKFQKINPYATHHWDIAAANAGQRDKLYRTINSAIRSGRF